jgi:hypothetical protein
MGSVQVFIGYDPREHLAWQVCAASLQHHARRPLPVTPIYRQALEAAGYYRRPHEMRQGVLWDVVSNQPCSTEFSIARFGLPLLAGRSGWAMFCDVDFLWRDDVWDLFDLADSRYALMCVQHDYRPVETTKMDGQVQRVYARKNWSSLMLWNLQHAANARFLPQLLNTKHRDDLHRFCWLEDGEIGALPERWNWLDGHSDAAIDPAAVHFTRGTPDMAGYEHTRYAKEWNRYAQALVKRAA